MLIKESFISNGTHVKAELILEEAVEGEETGN